MQDEFDVIDRDENTLVKSEGFTFDAMFLQEHIISYWVPVERSGRTEFKGNYMDFHRLYSYITILLSNKPMSSYAFNLEALHIHLTQILYNHNIQECEFYITPHTFDIRKDLLAVYEGSLVDYTILDGENDK